MGSVSNNESIQFNESIGLYNRDLVIAPHQNPVPTNVLVQYNHTVDLYGMGLDLSPDDYMNGRIKRCNDFEEVEFLALSEDYILVTGRLTRFVPAHSTVSKWFCHM